LWHPSLHQVKQPAPQAITQGHCISQDHNRHLDSLAQTSWRQSEEARPQQSETRHAKHDNIRFNDSGCLSETSLNIRCNNNSPINIGGLVNDCCIHNTIDNMLTNRMCIEANVRLYISCGEPAAICGTREAVRHLQRRARVRATTRRHHQMLNWPAITAKMHHCGGACDTWQYLATDMCRPFVSGIDLSQQNNEQFRLRLDDKCNHIAIRLNVRELQFTQQSFVIDFPLGTAVEAELLVLRDQRFDLLLDHIACTQGT
jgi:hypothetical protein